MENKEVILSVKDLKLWFDNDYGEAIQILNGISFDIHAGETLGIVGESGCGKSMTSLAIMRLVKSPPARMEGEIWFRDTELLGLKLKDMQNIRGNRVSMIFQEPMTSLNPVFTIGYQLSETLIKHQHLTKEQAWKRSVEILRLARVALPEQRMKEYRWVYHKVRLDEYKPCI